MRRQLKKKKAGEINKAKRSESADSATSASDASPRRGRDRSGKNSTARSPSPDPQKQMPVKNSLYRILWASLKITRRQKPSIRIKSSSGKRVIPE